MSELRWGILATGGIAHAFTSDLRTAGLTVAAVGSRSAASAQAFAATFDIPRAYGSYAELFADPEVDIVYIATPNAQHMDAALAAIAAGKHVLIEKAVTLTAAQAQQIADAATATGVLAMEAMWTRYLPHMARIREIIAAGTLGEIRTVWADHTQRLPSDPEHRINALSLGGGALLDLGVYPVSFLSDMLGTPTSIRAVGRLGETGADTEVSASFTHAGGVVSSMIVSSRGVGANTAHIVGTQAQIVIDSVWYSPTSFRVISPTGEMLEAYESTVEGRGMQYQALHAEEIIAAGGRDALLLPFAESIAVMATMDEIRAQIGVVYPVA